MIRNNQVQPPSPNNPVAAEPRPATLPEFWPDQSVAPVRPIWIPWPLAIVLAPLFWLMPKRFGPHFAAASWTAAILAHVTWACYGLASICLATVAGPRYTLASWLLGRTPEQLGYSLFPVPTLGEMLRAPLAFFACGPSQQAQFGLAAPPILTVSPLWLMFVDLATVVVLAILLMPFIAAGERTRLLLARTVRLVLWASTSLVVLAVAIQASIVHTPNYRDGLQVYAAIAVYCAWMIWLVMRGGSRYAGPADGPAWQPHSPLCVGCGYGLTALPHDGTCPECGRPVAESLPEHRHPSSFAAARSVMGRLLAFPGTYGAALWGRGFYERLATRNGSVAARRFVVWATAASAVLNVALLIGAWTVCERTGSWLPPMHWGGALGFCIISLYGTLGLLGLTSLVSLLVSRFGYRPLHNRSIAAFYWSAWLLPIGTTLILTLTTIALLLDRPHPRYFVHVASIGRLDLYAALVSLLLVIPVLVTWRSLVHLARAIRAVRYANG